MHYRSIWTRRWGPTIVRDSILIEPSTLTRLFELTTEALFKLNAARKADYTTYPFRRKLINRTGSANWKGERLLDVALQIVINSGGLTIFTVNCCW